MGGRFLTRETCNHLYSAWRIACRVNEQKLGANLTIVEIGGGYGGTCYWLRKVLSERISRYIIVDLPEVGLVQAYFLGMTQPGALVLPGEHRKEIASSIELVPHFRISEIDCRATVMFNEDSMPEMPPSEVKRYLAWGAANIDVLFISFNQETLSENGGEWQVSVPEAVEAFPTYQRIARETSWARRGYVEEAYAITPV